MIKGKIKMQTISNKTYHKEVRKFVELYQQGIISEEELSTIISNIIASLIESKTEACLNNIYNKYMKKLEREFAS
jgi:Glu-tRNA(Gln) amidotransferase subunit E-like FAD-binding protein